MAVHGPFAANWHRLRASRLHVLVKKSSPRMMQQHLRPVAYHLGSLLETTMTKAPMMLDRKGPCRRYSICPCFDWSLASACWACTAHYPIAGRSTRSGSKRWTLEEDQVRCLRTEDAAVEGRAAVRADAAKIYSHSVARSCPGPLGNAVADAATQDYVVVALHLARQLRKKCSPMPN